MTRTLDNGIIIRPFEDADKALVTEFFDQMGGETRALFNSNGWNRENALSYFDPETRKENFEYYTAVKDGLMVGYVFLWETNTSVPDMGICVRDNCKGLHLGRDLMQFIIDRAKKLGASGLQLTTHLANARAQALYARMGFRRFGTSNGGEAQYLLRFDTPNQAAQRVNRTLPNGVVIRPFAKEDKAFVNAFFDQMGGETRAFFNGNDLNRNFANLFFGEGRDNTEYYLAEKDGAMVGYIFLWDTHTAVPWLGIAVHEGFKGQHLGRDLLQYLFDRVKDMEGNGLLLTTHLANIRAQALYARMGFERIGTSNSGEALYLRRFCVKENKK